MCGIAAVWDVRRELSGETAGMVIRRMTRNLIHRGPDDEGYFCDESAGLSLGFRRLSIIDLSPQGHQPMVSSSGRYVMVFNGEVYNFAELRRELEALGFGFRGRSDTEVMLAAIEAWGVEQAIKRFVGMFSIALWDQHDRELILVRDRLGIKPLYYGWAGRFFVIGSELQAIRASPEFDNTINRDALASFLRYNYVPGPFSIYQWIYKLQPGTLLRVTAQLAKRRASANELHDQSEVYWSAREMAESGVAEAYNGSPAEAVDQLEVLLRDAVRLRMVSDVPLGAFLSGGVDSSTVVALMQAESARPVKTFSIGFDEDEYNEAHHAAKVARHLGADHTELYVTSKDALDTIPQLPDIYGEPFADSSQIPTFLVSKLARTQVTVSLSGDGGDELFAGYNRYFLGRRLWRWIDSIPKRLRRMGARTFYASPNAWGKVLAGAMPLIPSHLRVHNPRDKIGRLAEILNLDSVDAFYSRLVSHWPDPADVVINGWELPTVLTDPCRQTAIADSTARMMYADLVSYLPDDILTKVDRASMAVSLEARVPLLDHRVVEFAWRLPLSFKIRSGQSKWILRQILYRYVPRKLIERPKMGFGVPIDQWLCGPLRDWTESLLSEDRLRREGYFNPGPIRTKWLEHLSGKRRWHYHLWDVLMFQAWLLRVNEPLKALPPSTSIFTLQPRVN